MPKPSARICVHALGIHVRGLPKVAPTSAFWDRFGCRLSVKTRERPVQISAFSTNRMATRPRPTNQKYKQTCKQIIMFSSRTVKDRTKYTSKFAKFATKAQNDSTGVRALFSF